MICSVLRLVFEVHFTGCTPLSVLWESVFTQPVTAPIILVFSFERDSLVPFFISDVPASACIECRNSTARLFALGSDLNEKIASQNGDDHLASSASPHAVGC